MTTVLLPACTFGRVFDTVPRQEVLTLAELTASLRRFEVKTGTAAAIEREVARIEKGRLLLHAGDDPRGKFMGKLHKAGQAAKRAGKSVERAIDQRAAELVIDARKGAKRDLRLWSPALYAPGAHKRGTEGVTHVSCLVLDYDDGTPIRDVSTTFGAWFHILYTTWSHLPERPRFRLVLPLSFAVPAEYWSQVWSWAETLAHFEIDPSMKSPAATYALPAVPHRAWPREAFSVPGALLDPVDEGILSHRSALSLKARRPEDGEPSVLRGEDPDKQYVDHDAHAPWLEEYALWESEPSWTAPPELIAPAPPEPISPAPPTPERPTPPPPVPAEPLSLLPRSVPPSGLSLDSVASRLEDVLERLEGSAQPATVVEGLGRLAALREAGHLTKSEFTLAKRRLLAREGPGAWASVGPGRKRRTICLDFDGVLHSYVSGWSGPTVVADPPVDGAIAFLEEAVERYEVAIVSVRNAYPEATYAMRAWLLANGLPQRVLERVRFPRHKPPAEIYLDDRAVRFEGTFPSFESLGALVPWNR
ncbi:MAG: hypothetical protein AB8I08_16030 [Sandaracinaceae bacterium]